MIPQDQSRRQFLKTSTAVAAPWIVPAAALGRDGRSPNDRINFGVIGLGGRGMYLLHSLLKHKDVRVVGVCDVHEQHYRDNPWGKGFLMGRLGGQQTIEKAYGSSNDLVVTDDFREICALENVDAVLVATPDHWHALCVLEAIRHGKDVYGEKPICHTFAEGQTIRDRIEQSGTIFQTGSQQRSDPLFRKAVELVINGHIGKVRRIEVGLPPGYADPQGDDTIATPPEGLDYDRWCGPAPKLPYMRARHHRWWRGHRAYGGGVLMDWIGHHNDIAHWSLDADQSGPLSVEAVDWKFPATKVYDTPQHYEIVCEYAGGVRTSISNNNKLGTKWIGDEGWIYANRGKLTAADDRLLADDFERGSKQLFASPGHTQNFLDCVRSRQTCVAPAETAHRSITPGFLGYVSHQLGRKLEWDAKAEQVINDEEANRLLNDNLYRAPWSIG